MAAVQVNVPFPTSMPSMRRRRRSCLPGVGRSGIRPRAGRAGADGERCAGPTVIPPTPPGNPLNDATSNVPTCTCAMPLNCAALQSGPRTTVLAEIPAIFALAAAVNLVEIPAGGDAGVDFTVIQAQLAAEGHV